MEKLRTRIETLKKDVEVREVDIKMLEAQFKTAKVEEGTLLLSGKSLFTPLVTQIFETLPDKEGANEIRTMFIQFQRMSKHWAGGIGRACNRGRRGQGHHDPIWKGQVG